MAGGKETPRQKLIGLMYLVLLALLALQVGAEIMNKFFELNQSMEISVEEADEKAKSTFAAIEKAVSEDGRAEAKAALDEAKKLDEATNKIHKIIDDIKAEMIKETGGTDPEKGNIPFGMKDTDVSGRLLIGDSGKGTKLGKSLEKGLDEFVKVLNVVQVSVADLLSDEKKDLYKDLNLTQDGKEHPLFKKSDDHKTANWLQISFDHTPMISALAFLTEREARVANLRAEVLSKIKKSMGAADVKFDEIFPMASAESEVVAAGTKYKAKLFLTARSSAKSFKPEMFKDGKPLKVEGGEAKIEFRAAVGGAFDKKRNAYKRSFKGTIKYKDGRGKDQVSEETFTYYVTKPVLQVQSGAVAALYSQCGNNLIINCPALGAAYSPSFSATGAQTRKGKKKEEVIIIPSRGQKKVALTVSSGGQKIGVEKFSVRKVPKPQVIPYVSAGRKADLKNGIAPPRKMILKAEINDEYFKQNLPRDSKYYVSAGTVQLVRGRRAVGSPKNFSSGNVSLGQIAGRAQPGDRLVFEIKSVKRKTYLGGYEPIRLSASEGLIVVPLAK